MGGPLDTLGEHLTLAREYALLGNYDTALIFFEGVHAQINKLTLRGKPSRMLLAVILVRHLRQ